MGDRETVERYLGAVAGQDWDTLRSLVSDAVVRVGPFGDVFEGREPYVRFLQQVVPSLAGYRMDVARVVEVTGSRTLVAELSETAEVDGQPLVTPECLVFELDADGLIRHISIYIQRS